MNRIPGARRRFRLRFLATGPAGRLRWPQRRDVTRVVDAENEEDARQQVRQKFEIETFHWVKEE